VSLVPLRAPHVGCACPWYLSPPRCRSCHNQRGASGGARCLQGHVLPGVRQSLLPARRWYRMLWLQYFCCRMERCWEAVPHAWCCWKVA
jgi:hypothetical protein